VWSGPRIRRLRVDNEGWTNLMLEVNGSWMVRIPRWREAADSLSFEVQLLEYLRRHLRVRIPEPVIVGSLDSPRGWPFFAYRKLPGAPLRRLGSLSLSSKTRVARFLDDMFVDLGRCRGPPLVRIGILQGDPATYSGRYERLRSRYEEVGAGRLPDPLAHKVSQLLNDAIATVRRSRFRPVLLHGDLWPSHILWNELTQRPTGVIDWEDARLGDPAANLVALEDLGPTNLLELGDGHRDRSDRLFWHRVELYWRLLPLWGYLFGVQSKQADTAGRHLEQLRRSVDSRPTWIDAVLGVGGPESSD